MSFTVTVTNQGQISIPAELRRKFKLNGGKTLVLRDTPEGQIAMTPVPDFFELKGAFKTRRKISSKKAREAFGEYLGTRITKRGNFPLPHVTSV